MARILPSGTEVILWHQADVIGVQLAKGVYGMDEGIQPPQKKGSLGGSYPPKTSRPYGKG